MKRGALRLDASPDSPHRHLTSAAMAELLNASPNPEDVAGKALRHLLDRCGTCRAVYETLEIVAHDFGHWDYVAALAETEAAPELWRRLEALSRRARTEAVESDESLQTWGLCRLLQRHSEDLAGEQPESAAELARLAVRICGHLDEAYDRDWIQDLTAASYALLGNAWRALGELHSAGDAFATARGLRGKGTGSPLLEAEALALEALLLRDRRLLRQAATTFGAAASAYSGGEPRHAERSATDAHLAGRAMAHQAWCLYHLGEQAAAPALLAEAAERVDEAREPGLALGIYQGRVWSALVLARLGESAALLPAATAIAAGQGDKAAGLRLRRAEARILAAHGDTAGAAQALHQVIEAFLEMDHGIDGALCVIDLAHLHLGSGDLQGVRDLAMEVMPAFSSQEVDRVPMIMLLFFQEACASDRLTVGLVRHCAIEIERNRRPSLAWWSGWGTVPAGERTDDAKAQFA